MSTAYFPMSYAIPGHFIPGVLSRYPVKIVNSPDGHQLISHRKKVLDPVKKFPSMNEPNSAQHPMMQKLQQMLQKSGQAQMQPGYERVKEDLSWRGGTQAKVKTV